MFLTCISCERKLVTQDQARGIARERIKSAESLFKIDASKLPPLSERINNGFDFWVDDDVQNIMIFVHVSPTGLPEISGEPLDKYRRDGERIWKEIEKRRKGEPESNRQIPKPT